jgi:hypothetical protein
VSKCLSLIESCAFHILQAPPRSEKSSGRKRGKSMVATATPELMRIQQETEDRLDKKNRKAPCKKNLFHNGTSAKTAKAPEQNNMTTEAMQSSQQILKSESRKRGCKRRTAEKVKKLRGIGLRTGVENSSNISKEQLVARRRPRQAKTKIPAKEKSKIQPRKPTWLLHRQTG